MNLEKRTTIHKKGIRKLEDVTLAVVHYTGSLSLDGTLSWFGDKRSKVSAQYVIGREGEVIQYDNLLPVMWHCGRSEWDGVKWCNRRAVGYELVATFDSGFTRVQIDSLIELLYKDVEATAIKAIVGHEHISPIRKVDPGPEFDWKRLRDTHKENPFRNYLHEPVNHIGAHPIYAPRRGYAEEEHQIESGRDAPYIVWKPSFFK
tara:strand:- start:973 stop:1584 length:612 start_codon:yes stop_codon:yes gene_type:complete